MSGTIAMEDCPFCGKSVDLDDMDTLYPSGTVWLYNEELQMRTYHRGSYFMHDSRFIDLPESHWCYGMHCPQNAGGCGAKISADSKEEAIAKWNKRK